MCLKVVCESPTSCSVSISFATEPQEGCWVGLICPQSLWWWAVVTPALLSSQEGHGSFLINVYSLPWSPEMEAERRTCRIIALWFSSNWLKMDYQDDINSFLGFRAGLPKCMADPHGLLVNLDTRYTCRFDDFFTVVTVGCCLGFGLTLFLSHREIQDAKLDCLLPTYCLLT